MIFLRKIIPGATDDSFGVEVAKLAGLPAQVVTRARQILNELEAQEGAPVHRVREEDPDDQMSMLDLGAQQVRQALEGINVETLTPIEAMNELYKLKKLLN
jgi:DNA mismatch repair protein MutS